MAKKKVVAEAKKALAKKKAKLTNDNGTAKMPRMGAVPIIEVPSDSSRINVLEQRLDRLVAALSTAKPIKKDY